MEAPTLAATEQAAQEIVQTASCVVIGRFNPAILTPAWIIKEGILPAGETEVGQGVGGNVAFRLAGILWQPTLTKLEVHTDTEGSDPGTFVAEVLSRLPHTPIRAVGNNFTTELPTEFGTRLYPLVSCPLVNVLASPEHDNLAESVTLTLSHQGEAIVRVTLEVEQSVISSVAFNFHRECASAVAGVKAAELWEMDCAEARDLLARILQ